MSWLDRLDELTALLGPEGVLTTDAALFTYEADALALERARPDVVVLPRSTDEVAAVMRWASELEVAGDPARRGHRARGRRHAPARRAGRSR